MIMLLGCLMLAQLVAAVDNLGSVLESQSNLTTFTKLVKVCAAHLFIVRRANG